MKTSPISEETELVICALEAATQGIAAAVEQDSITPSQIDCLLSLLIKQLVASLAH